MDDSAAEPLRSRAVWGAYAASAVIFLLAWEPIVLGRYLCDAYSNYDLGLYSQAIYRLSWSEPNPWLTVRESKIFNDHFDPILFVAAPLAKIIDPAMAGLLVELTFVLACPLAAVWLWKRGVVSASAAAVVIFYLLHNRGTISAFLFPIHPTTWAILPSTFLAAALLSDARGVVLAALVTLFCCKEETPLMGLAVALIYAGRRQFGFAFLVASLSAGWLAGAAFLRPLLLGPVTDYVGSRLLMNEGWWASVERGWREFNGEAIGRVLLPLVPLAGWLAWRRQRAPVWLWLVILPSLGVRFLGRIWEFHYLAPVVPFFVLGLVPQGPQIRVPRQVVVAVVALLVGINGTFWMRQAKFLVREDAQDTRPWNAARLAAIGQAREYLQTHPEGKALIQSNLMPRLITRPDVYQVAGPHDRAEHTFRYVLIEKPPHGDPWPVTFPDIRQLLAEWRAAPQKRVIRDDDHVFLAEGAFKDLPGH